MFGSILNTYVSNIKSMHHSYFYTHQFYLVAYPFPSLSPYPHGDTESFIFVVPYDNIYDILYYFHPHIRYRKVLHHIGRMICDPHHKFCSYTRN